MYQVAIPVLEFQVRVYKIKHKRYQNNYYKHDIEENLGTKKETDKFVRNVILKKMKNKFKHIIND